MHDTPDTFALHACISVVIEEPVQPPPPAHVGVVQVLVCTPVRSHVPGIVCVQLPHAPHVVAPHAAPTTDVGMHACISVVDIVTHAPPVHAAVVLVRICVPVVAHAAPTMHTDQSPVVGVAQGVPSVLGRVHDCDSGASVATQVPPPQYDVVTMRPWLPTCVQGSLPKSHADQSP